MFDYDLLIEKVNKGFGEKNDKYVSVSANGKGLLFEIKNEEVGLFYIKVGVNTSNQRIENIVGELKRGFKIPKPERGLSRFILDETITTEIGKFSIIGIPISSLSPLGKERR